MLQHLWEQFYWHSAQSLCHPIQTLVLTGHLLACTFLTLFNVLNVRGLVIEKANVEESLFASNALKKDMKFKTANKTPNAKTVMNPTHHLKIVNFTLSKEKGNFEIKHWEKYFKHWDKKAVINLQQLFYAYLDKLPQNPYLLQYKPSWLECVAGCVRLGFWVWLGHDLY